MTMTALSSLYNIMRRRTLRLLLLSLPLPAAAQGIERIGKKKRKSSATEIQQHVHQQ